MDTKKQSSLIEIVKSRFAGKGLRKDYLIIALLFGMLLLVIAMPVKETASRGKGIVLTDPAADTGQNNKTQGDARQSYEKQLENRLEAFLGQVDGVGKVQVLIRLKDTGEQVVEKDVPTRSTSQTDAEGSAQVTEENREETTVFEETEDGRQVPYVIREYAPQISGVVVAAEGAKDPGVEQDILEAVQALLQVEVHKIKVLKLKEVEGLY